MRTRSSARSPPRQSNLELLAQGLIARSATTTSTLWVPHFDQGYHAAMELGLTTFAEITDPSVSPGERLRQVVEEAKLADELGLEVYAIGEHHRPDMVASAPEIVLATIAGCTKTIKLSSAVIVLSSADPVRVFQNFVTLDLLSNGRAELMVGRGSFTESFPLFGYSLSDYDELFAEKLDLLVALRDKQSVTWNGKFRPPLDNVTIYPRQEDHPLPIWVAVGGTPNSVVRAGTLGLPMALAIIGGRPAAFTPLVELYRKALEYGEHDAGTPLAVHSHGYVFTDERAARAQFLPAYRRTFAKIGRERGWPPMSDEAVEELIAPEGALFFGNPETVAAKIIRLHQLMQIDRFEMHVAHVDHALTMRSIELFGTEVARLVREELGARSPV
jgi:probable LLM family oxidoreductase